MIFIVFLSSDWLFDKSHVFFSVYTYTQQCVLTESAYSVISSIGVLYTGQNRWVFFLVFASGAKENSSFTEFPI